jgi:hypothetical protein
MPGIQKKSLPFLAILCYYLGFKKEVQITVFSQPALGWRIISTNLPDLSIMADDNLTE